MLRDFKNLFKQLTYSNEVIVMISLKVRFFESAYDKLRYEGTGGGTVKQRLS